jgi:hypothetical protein
MKRVYLLTYSRDLGTRQQVKECLDTLPEVITWRAEIPSTFFIVSPSSPEKLGKAIQACVGAKAPRFLIVELGLSERQTWGWLTEEGWDFIADQGVTVEKEEK